MTASQEIPALSMPLEEAMETQRAIRCLKPDPIDDALVLRLIELAPKAPTGGNAQGWEFIVVKDREVKERLARLNRQTFRIYGGMRIAMRNRGVLALLGASVPVGALLTAVVTGYVLVGTYEWTHFLIHTAYRPRTRYYRSIWRSHRLHHFKNEHYWHGVTTTVGDRVLGTFPDHSEVPRSKTARTLDPGSSAP